MPTLYTIGHSNRTLKEFITLLAVHQITKIIDIRTIPKSRYVPWFNDKSLMKSLNKENIEYVHLAELGGLRKTNQDSINQAWQNKSFRGFADYMQTPAFFAGLKNLNLLIKKEKSAILCSEALPWRCHRSLIADAEVIRGIPVFHILSQTHLRKHSLTSFAVVDKTKRPIKIYYPELNNSLTLHND